VGKIILKIKRMIIESKDNQRNMDNKRFLDDSHHQNT